MTKKLIIMIGVPSSGKSTAIKGRIKELEACGYTTASISRDYHRKALVGDGKAPYFSREKEVFRNFVADINECLASGIDYVFVDATHVTPTSRAKILSKLRPDASTQLEAWVLYPSLDECLRRNSKRTGFDKVPEGAIRKMYQDFVFPTIPELEKFDFKGKITITIGSGIR